MELTLKNNKEGFYLMKSLQQYENNAGSLKLKNLIHL